MQDLTIRLGKLERQVRVWRSLTICSLILCAAGVVTHLQANPNWIKATRVDATAVVAREFDLVNPSGRVTAKLVSDPDDPDSPNLAFKYANDKPGILLGIDRKLGSSLTLLNSHGQPRIIMSDPTDGPHITLFDEDARIRIVLDAGKQGPQISIYDKNRKRTVVAFSD
jgi:hypothetical protein